MSRPCASLIRRRPTGLWRASGVAAGVSPVSPAALSRCLALGPKGSALPASLRSLSQPRVLSLGAHSFQMRFLSSSAVPEQGLEDAAEEPQQGDAAAPTPSSSAASGSRKRGGGPSASFRPSSDSLDRRLRELSNRLRRSGRVNLADLAGALALMKDTSADSRVSPNSALLLLRCCGEALPDERPQRRTQLALELWQRLEESGTPLDASHYNALLSCHLDNAHRFSPTEFLAWMESKGVAANRVTFQCLVAKFCAEGDVSGATAVLDHMKKEKMPVNESIFHSLILGHCRAGDRESARSAMEIMEESGLHAGSMAHLAFLTGMIRGGNTVEEVVFCFSYIDLSKTLPIVSLRRSRRRCPRRSPATW